MKAPFSYQDPSMCSFSHCSLLYKCASFFFLLKYVLIVFEYSVVSTSRGSWMDVWERMSQECRAEVLLVDCACLLETLDTHLQKHG